MLERENIFQELTERERDILLKVAELYIKTGEPVGSRTVQKVYQMGISSATIRNVMADLEDKGFLYQPHTSAGRIPTDEGLKIYINHLFLALGEKDSSLVNRLLDYVKSVGVYEVGDILSTVLDFLQNSTGYLGFGINLVENLTVNNITLVKVAYGKVLVVVNFSPDHILHKVIDVEIAESELSRLSRELTKRFKGKVLSEIKKELVEEIDTVRKEFADLSFKVNSQILSTLNEVNQLKLQGTSNIVNVLADDIERLKEILRILEEKNILLEMFSEFLEKNKNIDVILGSETEVKPFEPFSFVLGKFQVGYRNSGVIGIIGPKRMDYSQIIPIVENVAKALSYILSNEYT
ncbi:heat-inducible transcription repressor HrcA [Desulfurobacterium thermolithotrophum DSM 11699]|uniref:Heat-inducible transcription repressor HrcA n=1 Tax=Desulfurobacterium thermolithotrophum (strain DSM 11699 / BSA) TaxID=868864 RepID=F0S3X4_DESTD|nr:heat-inducible transcriptional repressor HrcA [Desulfurobacterium thermolithotrophum]ADY73546.1 heat-inducible transcription repressor HrcA [Desulfurobacterium thermolithotrophum DSM 11699]